MIALIFFVELDIIILHRNPFLKRKLLKNVEWVKPEILEYSERKNVKYPFFIFK